MRGQTLADLRHPGARARGPEPTTTRSEEERIACGPLIYFSKKPHSTLLETSTRQIIHQLGIVYNAIITTLV